MHNWRFSIRLLGLFLAMAMGWTAVTIQAQSDSGYPPPPIEQTPELPDESYPPPIPLPGASPQPAATVALPTDEGREDSNDPALLPWGNETTPSRQDTPSFGTTVNGASDPAPTDGGSAAVTRAGASSLASKLFLWVAFIAAQLIFAAALFWSIILFNRQAVLRR